MVSSRRTPLTRAEIDERREQTAAYVERFLALNPIARTAVERNRARDRHRYFSFPEKSRAYYAEQHDRMRETSKGWRLMRLYGMTQMQVDEMIVVQGSRCRICSSILGRPHVDHCHSTGKVRGILCGKCNRGLGQFNDNPAILLAAIAYLSEVRP